MPYVRCLPLALLSTFLLPSLPAIADGTALTGGAICSPARTADSGDVVLAQYITREEQNRRAQENLERHRQERSNNNSNSSVGSSSGTATGETYGREYLERQLQGDKPRTRTW